VKVRAHRLGQQIVDGAAPRWLKVVVDLFVSVQLGHLQHPEFVFLHGVVAVRLP